MEQALEKGEDKIQKICDALRRETLEPAKQEAAKIVKEARERAEHIVSGAHTEAENVLVDARQTIEQERNVFHSSLEQAGKQALEELRQAIEYKLFHDELYQVIANLTSDPKVITKLISSIVKAIEKEGISTELSVVISEAVAKDEINRLLGDRILGKLKEGSVTLGEFVGGAQVKLHDKKMTLDITDVALMELLSNYVRKDFRKLLFKTDFHGGSKP